MGSQKSKMFDSLICGKSKMPDDEEDECHESLKGTVKGIKRLTSQQFKRLPLTPKMIFSLQASWKAVRRNLEETGVYMFMRLFKTSTGLKYMFQNFAHIQTDDELRASEALEHHATLVMSTLDDAITNIDNFDFVTSLLHRTGASHIKFANFKSSNFLAIKEPFLEAVRVTLGDRYTENMQNIYQIAIAFVLDTLVEGMEEALSAAGQPTNKSPAHDS